MTTQRRSCTTRMQSTTTPKMLALGILLAANGLTQGLLPAPSPATGDPVMGFENPKGWVVQSSSPLTTVAAVSVRTQGSFALALGNPSNPTTLTSAPIAATSPALKGVADGSALLEIDVMPPAGASGSLELALTSPSRGLKAEVLGKVDLQGLHPGIYNTLKFPIPDLARPALGDTAVKDLSFQLVLAAAGETAGSKFLFDNLRVVAVPLLTAKLGVTVPPNFGGSVDLVATGATPVQQSFAIAAVQMPQSFRLVKGTAGATSVTLVLGHDGASTYTCTYDPDPSDQTGQSYAVASCTGGIKAGDLVGVNFAELTIVGGTPTMTIDAQLAKNPIGDLVGSEIIPPMPTFWGHSDACVPAPVAGKVVTTTAACQAQVAESSQIVTSYFNQVKDSQAAPNWIATPAGSAAIHNGTGLADPGGPITTTQSNNFPFDKEGHMNQGGSFDAYWRLNGDLNFTSDTNTGDSTAHFDATFGGHVVLLGNDVDVMSVNVTADAASGSHPTSTGSAHVFLFGQELPGGGSVNASTGFNYNLQESTNFNVFTAVIWIFSIEVDATASASLNATGTLALTGFNLTVDPKVTMGTHIFGGVDIGVASGGVDAKIDLLDVEAPVTAQAGLGINTAPTSCALTINLSLNAKVTVSALGGEIDLVGTLGVCPFCYTDSYTLLKWDPVVKVTQNLFSVGPTSLAAIPLPVPLCTAPLSVSILSPAVSANTGLTYPLESTIADSVSRAIGCNSATWSVTPAETITTSANGCQVSIQFNNVGAHTLTLRAVENITDQFGRTIAEAGSASRNLAVSSLQTGAFITGASPVPSGKQAPFNNQTETFNIFSLPASIQLTGEFSGAAGPVNLTWTATDTTGHTVVISASPCASPVCTVIGANQQTVTWKAPGQGSFTIKMVATDAASGKQIGSATMIADVQLMVLKR